MVALGAPAAPMLALATARDAATDAAAPACARVRVRTQRLRWFVDSAAAGGLGWLRGTEYAQRVAVCSQDGATCPPVLELIQKAERLTRRKQYNEALRLWEQAANHASVGVAHTSGQSLDAEELQAAADMFKKFDVDGSGKLQGEELIKLAEWVFSSLHPDRGTINKAELKKLAADIVKATDEDDDDSMSFEEFVQWFEKKSAEISKVARVAAAGGTPKKGKPAPRGAAAAAVLDEATLLLRIGAAEAHIMCALLYNQQCSKDHTTLNFFRKRDALDSFAQALEILDSLAGQKKLSKALAAQVVRARVWALAQRALLRMTLQDDTVTLQVCAVPLPWLSLRRLCSVNPGSEAV